jgi:hypothetical protein
MADSPAPLSPTVASIFGEFIKKLESEKVLGAEAIEALRQAFEEQKLDPESLRKAVFMAATTAQ